MMQKLQKFFLASNSCYGFISHFTDNFNASDNWSAYILKGGPGCGKSSFIRHFASHALEKNLEAVLCPCTSDPDSLDGLILPTKKIIVLDGTKPHCIEPEWPGLCEEIVNLGQFWDAGIIKQNRSSIIEASRRAKLFHRRAALYLCAAGQVMTDSLNLAYSALDSERCMKFAGYIAESTLPDKKEGTGREWIRFLQGITPLGIVSYTDTVKKFYRNIIVLEDPFGASGNIFMNVIREKALYKGYEIITVKNAFLPEDITDHILIPELSTAFVTENKLLDFSSDGRKIHSRRFMDASKIHNCRKRIIFNRHIAKELLEGAVISLQSAKNAHDKLEQGYIPAMDWNKAAVFAEKFVSEKL